ncbi:MAG: undecaprenyldiphospho-muramoylpentapeptide beta-N-acetylglucosaminyltransferase [Oscillospiraceae bacterium]|nr:undecaprenyldiphospho-muramoylpentapeptide beta-N-acetylglucosaminyltransferase [Oscillospiraceae bacterium]
MRVLVSGGGTAGHINPAIAIADKIKAEQPDSVIEYVGTPSGMENQLVPKAGYKIHGVAVKGFKRKLSLDNIDAAVKAFTSVSKAKKIIKDFAPDIVIGTGGYVCWPVMKAAAKMGIPTAIHESNAVPGVTTKMLSKKVDKIMISFESTKDYFDCDRTKFVLTGNPVSEKILKADKAEMRKKLGIPEDKTVILSAGGSLGAKKVNEAVFGLIKEYSVNDDNVYHFHATGRGGFDEQAALYEAEGFERVDEDSLVKNNVAVMRYIYNMPEVLACADIVVCRAGAMTLSEIAAMKKSAVIIPSPNVTNNHQYKNAKVLADGDAAILIEEKDLTGELLTEKVRMYADDKMLRVMTGENIKKFAVYDTLDRIYDIVCGLTKK